MKKIIRIFCLILPLAGLVLLLTRCSTEKKGFAHRSYHNVTAHYNGYFNGRESMKDGIRQLEGQHEEDFTKILPIFLYGDESSSKTIYPQMDKAIEKCSKVIQRHSIFIRRKEYNNWIDDSYMVIGKSHFYKREYAKALEIFKYVGKDFKHEELHYEALVWQARTLIQLERLEDAGTLMDKLEKDREFPKYLKGDEAAVYADLYVRQKNYTLAATELKRSITHTKKKQDRIRRSFVLAQLYQEDRNYKDAVFYYGQVAKMNASYEMEFYAKINQALAYNVGAGDSEAIKEQLKKMLRDDKNTEFYDQIYYALAEIEIKEGHVDQAIEYLKESTAVSVSNNNQKGLSFVKLGDIHFDMPEYELAQAYYDSAVNFINPDYPDYTFIVNKKNSLTELVENINEINLQDSMQVLANMSEDDRLAAIDDIIEQVIEEEERKKKEQQNNNSDFLGQNGGSGSKDYGTGAGWYFYNSTTLSFGFSEFKKIWGDRKLADNWRRKNKSSIVQIEDEENEDADGNDSLKASNNPKEREYYLERIPLTDEEMTVSHQKIKDAYYDLGLIYKEKLNDSYSSIDAFEELLRRYPKSEYTATAYYQLHRLYLADNDLTNSNKYKDLILKEYPDSDYAELIKNPNYFAQTKALKEDIEEYYEQSLALYNGKKYKEVMQRTEISDSLYAGSHIDHKFSFLKALTIGKTGTLDEFVSALKIVTAKHKETDVAKEAQRILDAINKQKAETEKKNDDTAEEEVAYEDPKGNHSLIMIVPNAGNNLSQIKTTISNYNKEFFRLQKLNVTSVFLDKGYQMVSVKDFESKVKAMDYYKAFTENKTILKDINSKGFRVFAISFDNYPLFYKSKDTDKYAAFFKEKYL